MLLNAEKIVHNFFLNFFQIVQVVILRELFVLGVERGGGWETFYYCETEASFNFTIEHIRDNFYRCQ